MVSQLEKIIRERDKTIAKQNIIIDEMFILICERLTSEEISGLTPLFNQIEEVSNAV